MEKMENFVEWTCVLTLALLQEKTHLVVCSKKSKCCQE
jgi:hypothetical protein